MSSPLPIWFRLFDSSGKQWPETTAAYILSSSLVIPLVHEFREAVKAKYDQPNYLQNIPSSTLLVYRNEESFKKRNLSNDEGNEYPLRPSFSIIGLGQNDEEEALIVFVPSVRVNVVDLVQSFPIDKLFVDKSLSVHRQNEFDKSTKYFTMAKFPPLAHPVDQFSKIIERDSYIAIFADLMYLVKDFVVREIGANLIVTGNPGIGKSRFYLYCIFQLLFGQQKEAMEVRNLPNLVLVLNYAKKYHKYDPSTREFVRLNELEVDMLSEHKRVLRLIEANSSLLGGWKGISILFSSPGLDGLTDFGKNNTSTFTMPVWTLEELQEYNALLDDQLKLTEDTLISKYHMYGGIPRFVFTITDIENFKNLTNAIISCNPLDMILFVQYNHAVNEKNFSHRVLKMVPDETNFKLNYYLDFLSPYIAEKVVSLVESKSIHALSEFAILNESESTSVIRGRIYECLCHRWFNLDKQVNLRLRSLCFKEDCELTVPKDIPIVRFSNLDEIDEIPPGLTYCQPKSKTFGALDAFILDCTNSRCYGLQMTLNMDHGIKATPLNNFLIWLNGIGIATDCFYFTFVVPSSIASKFERQSFKTLKNTIHQKPGPLSDVMQYVAELDVFVEKSKGR
jgi:hypothetical protein